MVFAAMREHPAKYSPGAVLVGVPFETLINPTERRIRYGGRGRRIQPCVARYAMPSGSVIIRTMHYHSLILVQHQLWNLLL